MSLDECCDWTMAGAILLAVGAAFIARGLVMVAWGAKGGALTAAACLVGGPCL
jgi:hypothetical protein